MYTVAKKAARFKTTKPTMTDQSQAKDTDLNVIIRKFAATGQVMGNAKPPMIGADFTDAPTDLRGHIDAARNLDQLRKSLPPHFQKLTMEQLYAMDNDQLKAYHHHATKQNDKPKDKQTDEKPKDEKK